MSGSSPVPDELFDAARGDQAGDGDKTAVPLGQFGALPDITEQDVIGELDQLWGEVADGALGGARLGHDDLPPDRET